ncbi:hypothetical protein LUZ60_012671 [Juncus effusus]|nr:hypothetical protein LUZ60_012671 [Juncus effusus]
MRNNEEIRRNSEKRGRNKKIRVNVKFGEFTFRALDYLEIVNAPFRRFIQNPQNPNQIPPARRKTNLAPRNWAELHPAIFQKLSSLDVLAGAGRVCRSWRKVSKHEPELWRRIDVTKHGYGPESVILAAPTKIAIDRSKCNVEEFWIEYLGDDDLLQYLCDRTSGLKSLKLISCYDISDEGVIELAKRQPDFKELEIMLGKFNEEFSLPEFVGKELPNLKVFRFNGIWFSVPYEEGEEMNDDQDAFGIGKSMKELRCLQLIGNRITNKGLKAILQGCPHLETLDIRACHNIKMDPDLRARCGRVKTVRLPDNSLEDYEFQAEGSHTWSEAEAMIRAFVGN